MGSYTLFGMLVGGILSGMLSDLYGRRPLFIGYLSLFATCMVVTAWAPTPAWFGANSEQRYATAMQAMRLADANR